MLNKKQLRFIDTYLTSLLYFRSQKGFFLRNRYDKELIIASDTNLLEDMEIHSIPIELGREIEQKRLLSKEERSKTRVFKVSNTVSSFSVPFLWSFLFEIPLRSLTKRVSKND